MLGNNWLMLGAYGEEKDRSPPPPATPVEFPHWESSSSEYAPYEEGSAKRLYMLFSSIQKPSDVSGSHLDSLNLRVLYDQPLEALVPWKTTNGRGFLPDSDASTWTADNDGKKTMLSNGREAPGLDVFLQRVQELEAENDDAFRAVQRLQPRPGRKAVRPGYFYKFWQGLCLMAQSWDTSGDDDYEDVPVDKNNNSDDSHKDDGEDGSMEGKTVRKYKGRRIGTGKDMPDRYREDTIRALVDTAISLFGCQTLAPRIQPRIALQQSLFGVHLNCSVYRPSGDRQLARQGLVEGPLMAVQCRAETSFQSGCNEASLSGPMPASTTEATSDSSSDADEKHIENKPASQIETLDLMREVAAMLLLGQERAREGKSPTIPGQGKWYTTVPRWGGGPGGEISCGGDNGGATTKDEKSKDGLDMTQTKLGSGSDDETNRKKIKNESTSAAAAAASASEGSSANEEVAHPFKTTMAMNDLFAAAKKRNMPFDRRRGGSTAGSSQSSGGGESGKDGKDESGGNNGQEGGGSSTNPKNQSKNKRQSAAFEAYQRLQVGQSTWDSKVTYRAIGRITIPCSRRRQRSDDGRGDETGAGDKNDDNGGNEYDDFDYIFLVSSINHHVSLLRLKVHSSYLNFIERGELPTSSPSSPAPPPRISSTTSSSKQTPQRSNIPTDQIGDDNDKIEQGDDDEEEKEDLMPWYILELRRSQWYDLFSPSERIQALRGLWGIMSWLMRSSPAVNPPRPVSTSSPAPPPPSSSSSKMSLSLSSLSPRKGRKVGEREKEGQENKEKGRDDNNDDEVDGDGDGGGDGEKTSMIEQGQKRPRPITRDESHPLLASSSSSNMITSLHQRQPQPPQQQLPGKVMEKDGQGDVLMSD